MNGKFDSCYEILLAILDKLGVSIEKRYTSSYDILLDINEALGGGGGGEKIEVELPATVSEDGTADIEATVTEDGIIEL